MNCRIFITKSRSIQYQSAKAISCQLQLQLQLQSISKSISTTASARALKPGTPIAGLDFMKNADPVVSKERSEYPDWVNNLTEGDATLGKLRRMDMFSAEEEEQKRYLKLTRRVKIKADNVDAGLR